MATEHPSTNDHYVYALCRGDNGRVFYIGKGRGGRWLQHEMPSSNRRRSPKNSIIRNLRASGFDVVRVKIHEGLTETQAYIYEVALIKAIGRRPNGPLANLTDGGEGVRGVTQTPEHIEKRMAALRGKLRSPEATEKTAAANRGQKRSLEMRANLSLTMRGKTPSAETRKKLSAARRGKKKTPETCAKMSVALRGKKRSEGTKANMSAAQRKRKFSFSAATLAKMSARRTVENLGRKLSPETREKIAASLRGRKRAAHVKPAGQLSFL